MKDCIQTWLTRAVPTLAALFVFYVLTAPPMMMNIARQQGSLSFPAIYQPIVNVIESDFNGPALWYFNDVWHSGIILLGEPTTSPRVIMLYLLVGVVSVLALAFPFVPRVLRRRRVPRVV